MDRSPRTDRTRTFLRAIIAYNSGAAQVDCVVKNISTTGARLDVTDAVCLPATFDVIIPHRGETNRCVLVWRDKDTIGVRFVANHDEAITQPIARPLTEVENENVRLRKRVRELSARLEALGQDPLTDERY